MGRFVDERQPLSALCLSAETSSLTAILNDYGGEEVFARQVRAPSRASENEDVSATNDSMAGPVLTLRPASCRCSGSPGPPSSPR